MKSVVVVIGMCVAGVAIAAPDWAQQLAKLRTEVDDLASQVRDKRADMRADRDAWRAQRSALELSVRQTQQQEKALKLQQDAYRTELRQQSGKEERQDFERALERVRTYVGKSIPYRRDDRLSRLEQIAAHADTQAGLVALWRFIEEEKQLNRTIGLDRHAVKFNGKDHLVDVARLGMATMYVRFADGRIARASQQSPSVSLLEDPNLKAAVTKIFEQLREQYAAGLVVAPLSGVTP